MRFVPNDLTGARIADNDGYKMTMMKSHPRAHKAGYVYLHRLVMENKLGRYLESNEHVWHSDGDLLNNDPDNLSLKAPLKLGNRTCLQCGKEFRCTNARIRYCSPECGGKASRRCEHPPKEELQLYVWVRPTMHIAEDYGVSDVAVAKWCRKLGILKPPRGYWQKLQVGKDVRGMVPLSVVELFGGLSAVVDVAAVG